MFVFINGFHFLLNYISKSILAESKLLLTYEVLKYYLTYYFIDIVH